MEKLFFLLRFKHLNKKKKMKTLFPSCSAATACSNLTQNLFGGFTNSLMLFNM